MTNRCIKVSLLVGVASLFIIGKAAHGDDPQGLLRFFGHGWGNGYHTNTYLQHSNARQVNCYSLGLTDRYSRAPMGCAIGCAGTVINNPTATYGFSAPMGTHTQPQISYPYTTQPGVNRPNPYYPNSIQHQIRPNPAQQQVQPKQSIIKNQLGPPAQKQAPKAPTVESPNANQADKEQPSKVQSLPELNPNVPKPNNKPTDRLVPSESAKPSLKKGSKVTPDSKKESPFGNEPRAKSAPKVIPQTTHRQPQQPFSSNRQRVGNITPQNLTPYQTAQRASNAYRTNGAQRTQQNRSQAFVTPSQYPNYTAGRYQGIPQQANQYRFAPQSLQQQRPHFNLRNDYRGIR